MAALAALLFAAACGGGGDDSDDEATNRDNEDHQDGSTTSSTESTSTTTAAAEGPQEWVEVMNDVDRRLAEVLANPDPTRVADVIAETCNCWHEYYDDVETMAGAGTRWIGEGPRGVSFVQEVDRLDDGGALLTIRWIVPTIKLIDQSGQVLDEIPGGPAPACTSVVVKADGANGAWRLHQERQLDSCPEGAL